MKRLTCLGERERERERREGTLMTYFTAAAAAVEVLAFAVVVRPQQSLLSRMCFVFINRAASAQIAREERTDRERDGEGKG